MASESGSVVLRIKRKRTEDPLDALLVAQVFKKPHIEKNEDNDKGNAESKEDLLSSTVERVFKFVGSVPQGDDLKKKDLLAKIHKQCLGHENLMKSHIPDQQTIQERLRQKKKLLNQESRFKVISSLRGSETDSSSDQGCKTSSSGEGSSSIYSPSEEETVDEVDLEVQRLLSVFDVVKDEVQNSEPKREQRMLRKKQQPDETRAILCNSVKMIREKLTLSQEPKTPWRNPEKEGYVYDFYYPSDNYGRLGDIVEVLPFDSEFVHESLMDDFGEIYDDDDDSNDEGNWRNDYPDEEDNLSDSSQERRFFGDYGFDSDEEYRRYAFDDNLSDGD